MCQPILVHGDVVDVVFGDDYEDTPVILLNSFYLTQSLLNSILLPVVDNLNALLWLVSCYKSSTNVE